VIKMPAKSKTQRRLMGMAYCVKEGKCKLKDLPPNVRDEVKRLSRSMTKQQLRDFAKTKEKGLPRKKRKKK